jgi:hypothetical protein
MRYNQTQVHPCQGKPQALNESPPRVCMWERPPKKEIPKISQNFPKSLSEQIATPVNNEEM